MKKPTRAANLAPIALLALLTLSAATAARAADGDADAEACKGPLRLQQQVDPAQASATAALERLRAEEAAAAAGNGSGILAGGGASLAETARLTAAPTPLDPNKTLSLLGGTADLESPANQRLFVRLALAEHVFLNRAEIDPGVLALWERVIDGELDPLESEQLATYRQAFEQLATQTSLSKPGIVQRIKSDYLVSQELGSVTGGMTVEDFMVRRRSRKSRPWLQFLATMLNHPLSPRQWAKYWHDFAQARTIEFTDIQNFARQLRRQPDAGLDILRRSQAGIPPLTLDEAVQIVRALEPRFREAGARLVADLVFTPASLYPAETLAELKKGMPEALARHFATKARTQAEAKPAAPSKTKSAAVLAEEFRTRLRAALNERGEPQVRLRAFSDLLWEGGAALTPLELDAILDAMPRGLGWGWTGENNYWKWIHGEIDKRGIRAGGWGFNDKMRYTLDVPTTFLAIHRSGPIALEDVPALEAKAIAILTSSEEWPTRWKSDFRDDLKYLIHHMLAEKASASAPTLQSLKEAGSQRESASQPPAAPAAPATAEPTEQELLETFSPPKPDVAADPAPEQRAD